MHHLCGFYESQDSAVLVPTAALADPTMTVSGDNVQVPEYASMLFGVYAGGANLTRAQLQSPSLRRLCNLEVSPINVGAEPLSQPSIMLFPQSPIQLDVDEQLQAHMAEDAAGASAAYILAFLTDAPIQPVSGEIFTVRVTGATALVANVWTNVALTFDQVLPVGRYAIVGARFVSAGMEAFRFVIQGQTSRPGGIGADAIADQAPEGQRAGGWGVWGEFQSTNPPTVDFLSLSADASQTGEIDLIKIG